MPDIKERLMLSWDMVFKIATLVLLIFSGFSTEQVTTIAHQVARKTDHVAHIATEVQQQTQKVEQDIEATRHIVTQNQERLDEHEILTVEQQTMLAYLKPLFDDIVQRQHLIREDITQLKKLAENLHGHEEALATQFTERAHLFQEIATQLQALTQAFQEQQKERPQ